MTDILRFIHDSDYHSFPKIVQKMVQRCLIDLIGVAAAGSQTKASKIGNKTAPILYGNGPDSVSILFSKYKSSPAGAAFAGGNTIDSFDAHDGHRMTKGHAGAALLPALFAFLGHLENQGKALPFGREFLTCLAVGYEVSLRAGVVLHATACDYHTSGAWNAIGAAAMGARLFKMNDTQTRHALGIAEYYGPRSQMMRCIDDPTMVKDGSAFGALSGVSAVFLAQEGFTGAPAITLEQDMPDYWQTLGRDWEILQQYFKPVPVCRWAQPALQAIWNIPQEITINPVEIESIEIHTFHEAMRLAGHEPKTTEEAQYAIAFPVAALLTRGKLGATEISETDGLQDPEILNLSKKISLIKNEEYNDKFPGERWAHLRFNFKDGSNYQTEPACPIGDPESPLSEEFIKEKFYKNCAESFESDFIETLDKNLQNLEQSDDIKPLLSLLATPAVQ